MAGARFISRIWHSAVAKKRGPDMGEGVLIFLQLAGLQCIALLETIMRFLILIMHKANRVFCGRLARPRESYNPAHEYAFPCR